GSSGVCNALPPEGGPPTWRSFPSTPLPRAVRQLRLSKAQRTTPGIAGMMISSVIMRFPTLADFRMKRKMVKQDRHVSRNQTIESEEQDRKSTRLNSSHEWISYAV